LTPPAGVTDMFSAALQKLNVTLLLPLEVVPMDLTSPLTATSSGACPTPNACMK
jgi:hypothetical protein